MSGHYILDADGNPAVVDLLTWADWYENADEARRVARTQIGDADVSTVFLGLDHSSGRGQPLLFETMVFGGEQNGWQTRYSTREEADAGHAAAVAWLEGKGPEPR